MLGIKINEKHAQELKKTLNLSFEKRTDSLNNAQFKVEHVFLGVTLQKQGTSSEKTTK